ncbi:hypothetical protein RUM44_001807 [Polyplax serrata]|uniref:Uncharacterized protein n=1 Tax=Polyplax serrata TaxID=468196 RepID=A0ABR1AL36_POLSC
MNSSSFIMMLKFFGWKTGRQEDKEDGEEEVERLQNYQFPPSKTAVTITPSNWFSSGKCLFLSSPGSRARIIPSEQIDYVGRIVFPIRQILFQTARLAFTVLVLTPFSNGDLGDPAPIIPIRLAVGSIDHR